VYPTDNRALALERRNDRRSSPIETKPSVEGMAAARKCPGGRKQKKGCIVGRSACKGEDQNQFKKKKRVEKVRGEGTQMCRAGK